MCTVSNIGDYWRHDMEKKYSWAIPNYPNPLMPITIPVEVTKEEFNQLRKEVEELKKLLTAAIEYDKNTGQPHCETDSKVALIKAVAEAVGVDMKDVFG